MTPQLNDFYIVLPEIFLAICAMLLLVLGAVRGNKSTALISVLGIVASLLCAGQLASDATLWARATAFGNMFVTDGFAVVTKIICLIGVAALLSMSIRPLRDDLMNRFEFPVLVLLSGVGMMVMLSANNMLSVYVGLELSSLALYVLAAFRRETVLSAEAGMKYFILGALSSGMLLFGMSLIYGVGGSTNFDDIANLLANAPDQSMGMMIGMAFMLAGLAFKMSLVPFHMWTPDVYQGAPGSVTALFAMVPKIAAVGLLVRLLFVPFLPLLNDWSQIVAFLALASMMWSAFAAIAQTNIKRLLAYSSIGNMGYALVGVVAASNDGIAATLLYLAIYLAMTAGTFAVILSLRREGTMIEAIEDFAGLSRTHPVMAYSLAIMMFAMAGIPPLAGFFGKLMVFQAAIEQELYALAIVGVVTSVIAAYYYLKIVRVMFFNNPAETLEAQTGWGQKVVLSVASAFILGFILIPQGLYDAMDTAARALTMMSEP